MSHHANRRVERTRRDGIVTVNRLVCDNDVGDEIHLAVNDNGREQEMEMSEYNARRLLGQLAQVLELPLSAASRKEIE